MICLALTSPILLDVNDALVELPRIPLELWGRLLVVRSPMGILALPPAVLGEWGALPVIHDTSLRWPGIVSDER
jgi:hypothetical protein